MMGTNELHLNETTMIEALQFWLNSQLVKTQIVTGVSLLKDVYATTFKVTFKGSAQEEETPCQS